MPYPEEASTVEMLNFTIQALWSYRYMKILFFPGLPAPLATTLIIQNNVTLPVLLLKTDKESKSSVNTALGSMTHTTP